MNSIVNDPATRLCHFRTQCTARSCFGFHHTTRERCHRWKV